MEFAHWFHKEFVAAFSVTAHAAWRPEVSEEGWSVSARNEDGREVVATLPDNFSWFRPQPVARSIVVRLMDQITPPDNTTAERPRRTPQSSRRTH